LGEIADALRRARAESPDEKGAQPTTPRPDASEIAQAIVESALPNADAQRDWTGAAPLGGEPGHAAPQSLDAQAGQLALPGEETPGGELCRHLALRVHSELERRGARSLAIVSALRNEGKSTVACNLAIALASLTRGRGVALVDLDLRKPSVASVLGITAKIGIERVLDGQARLAEAVVAIDEPALDVFPAVEPQRNAHELLLQPAFPELLRQLEARYAAIVFDTPPTLLVPDTRLILRHVPVCAPIARTGSTRAHAFRQMVDVLPRGQILGPILNGNRPPSHSRDYYYYGDGHDDSDA